MFDFGRVTCYYVENKGGCTVEFEEKQRTNAETVSDLIRVVNQAISNEKNRYWAESGLTAAQIDVLMAVVARYNWGDGGETTQAWIEKQLHLSNATVSGIITRLEAKGFLERHPSERGGRRYNICLGPRALELNVSGLQTKSLLERYLLDGLSGEDVSQLIAQLKRVYRNVMTMREHEDIYLRTESDR